MPGNAAIWLIVLSFCLTTFFSGGNGLKLPSYITACRNDDPNLNECAVKAGRAAIPHFTNGDRKYKIPKLNPLTVYDFKVSQGTRSVGLQINMNEASIFGLPDMSFDAARVDLKSRHIEWDFTASNIKILGTYNITGRVLLLPLVGNGQANITLRDCTFNYTFDYDVEQRADGVEYMALYNDRLTFDTKRVYIKLANLFNGDRLLGNNMNHFLNENWKEVTHEVGPTIADAISEVFRQILTQISDLVPWKYVYPEG
ncbi:Protein takeout [Frankliniella fusca]|uniref:Protein takeout n=1 Tax=Frankliniella fusca TaxID=407009 RepID=A0AAE1HSW3_9NEOP|nr:Protein takeout [Frankliniella fusca]